LNTKQIQYFLIGAGVILSFGGGVRLYRVIRNHTEDHFFAPHLLLASLSLFIAWKVFKIGLNNEEKTRKMAISLIRSGSILMMIWSYRLYLLLRGAVPEASLMISPIVTILYAVMGTAIMCVGLKISRSLRVVDNGD
jgi:hypothetical protein